MATGILFVYEDRVLPDVAAKRVELETVIKPRIRAIMDAMPFTQRDIASYKVAIDEKQRYEHAKIVLRKPELAVRYRNQQVLAMQDIVASVESSPEKIQAFKDLASIGQMIRRFEECQKYMESGMGAMNNAQLASYLSMKQAQSYRRHDPIQALTEKQVGPDCPNPKQYIVVFDGLEYDAARAFCVPQDGNPKTALKRAYTFRFDLLPQDAKDDVENDLVPTVPWDPAYMELKANG